jgi:hypothetical protein
MTGLAQNNGNGSVTVVARETSPSVLSYEAVLMAVRDARTSDDVREWEDKIAAAKEYARRIRDRRHEIELAALKVDCKRRHGQLLADLKAFGRLREGRKDDFEAPDAPPRITLKDLGITKNESSEYQAIADIDGDTYQRLVERCRAYMEENPNTHAIDVLRAKDGPIKGARSLMGSRVEAITSLDYFPTPPWATRALMEHVLPSVGIRDIDSAWEPACGEGHISGVLDEYVRGSVVATDIFDYTEGDEALWPVGWAGARDFLDEKATCPVVDWIITNPPFAEKALDFTLRALVLAKVGVAMFVPLRWIETVDRYEKLFKAKPPTVFAPFVERVNLCKGKWDPKGSTATSYCWMVWVHGRQPRAPFWVPPGCRKALSHADDVERFTNAPEDAPADAKGVVIEHDPATGEIQESEYTEASTNSELSPAVAPQSEAALADTGSGTSAGCEADAEAGAQMLPPPILVEDDSIPDFLIRRPKKVA